MELLGKSEMWPISVKEEFKIHKEIMSHCSLSTQYASFYSLEQKHFKFIHENIHRKKTPSVVFGMGQNIPAGSVNHQCWVQGTPGRTTVASCHQGPSTWLSRVKSEVGSQQSVEGHPSSPPPVSSSPHPLVSFLHSDKCVLYF